MKLFKRLLSAASALMIVSAGVASIPAVASESEDNLPLLYTKLEYVDGNRVRVDVYLEDMASISSCGFHVQLGEGFDIAYSPRFPQLIWKEKSGTYADYLGTLECEYDPYLDNGFFITMTSKMSFPMILEDTPLCSFYVYKNSKSTDYNCTANIVIKGDDNLKDPWVNPSLIFEGSQINTRTMTKGVEYMLGDANGDGVLDVSDSTAIQIAVSKYPYQHQISAIENTFKDLCPYAKDAYALDVNGDGKLSEADSVAILQVLGKGDSYSGNVGKFFYHSYY